MYVKVPRYALDIFRQNGGQMRMTEAVRAGISRHTLYSLLKRGFVKRLDRGLYRLTEMRPGPGPDFYTINARYPGGVICLTSALAFHGIIDQWPPRTSLALPRSARVPAADYPPTDIHRFSEKSYEAGIIVRELDGVELKVYDLEKTLADCFKFRNVLESGLALTALKIYQERHKPKPRKLRRYAKICRVERVMSPYMEALL